MYILLVMVGKIAKIGPWPAGGFRTPKLLKSARFASFTLFFPNFFSFFSSEKKKKKFSTVVVKKKKKGGKGKLCWTSYFSIDMR